MVRQSDVKGAYTKVGDPRVRRHSGSGGGGRLAVALGFLLVAALFVSMGRTSSQQASSNADNALSGQAHHATSGLDVDTPGSASSRYYDEVPPSKTSGGSSQSHLERLPSPPAGDEPGEDDGGYDPPASSSGGKTSSSSGNADEDDGGDDDGSGDDGSGSGSDDSSSGSDDSSSGSDDSSSGSDDSASSSGDGDGGSSRTASGDSGMKTKAVDADPAESPSSNDSSQDGDDPNASETDRAEVQVANELRQIEKEEVALEEQKVQSVVGKIGSGLRIGLGRLFGDKASTEEIEELAEAVEAEVVAEIDRDVEAESATVLNEELQNLEAEVEEAASEGTPDHDIAEELRYQRTEAVDEMRHSIQEIEERVEKSIEARTSMAEKKVLEEKLSKKLGKTVKLTILDDEEEQFGGLEEAIKSLPSLRGTDSNKKKKKKKGASVGGAVANENTSRLDGAYGS